MESTTFRRWGLTYQWENLLGQDVLYSGPLFTHLFSHAWIDFRGMRDDFMREKRSDYFENSRRSIAVHREYGARNPGGYVGYGRNFWGMTAGDGPDEPGACGRTAATAASSATCRAACRTDRMTARSRLGRCWRRCRSTARRRWRERGICCGTYPQVCTKDRFSSGFNPTIPEAGGWLSEGWYGLDQGLLVMMIENYRSGFIWNITRGCPHVRSRSASERVRRRMAVDMSDTRSMRSGTFLRFRDSGGGPGRIGGRESGQSTGPDGDAHRTQQARRQFVQCRLDPVEDAHPNRAGV